MNYATTSLIVFFAIVVFSSLSYAYDGHDVYDCVISEKDRVTSKGIKLTKLRDILAQDRANYHKFNLRDADDSADSTFVTTADRKRWQTVKIDIDPALKRKIILGGNVEIAVFILTEDWIDIQEGLIDPNVS